jgi:class 3 adenylate cyclase
VRTLPEGTITLLFTDIEASTALLHRLGAAYATVLADQRAILRDAFAKWNGHEVDTQGDSFFVVFTRADDAVAAAAEAQRALAAHQWSGTETVRVRMGLHTGEPHLRSTGYVGLDVHRTARIAAAAHGGQVVISETTRDLVGDRLPAGSRCVIWATTASRISIAPSACSSSSSRTCPTRFRRFARSISTRTTFRLSLRHSLAAPMSSPQRARHSHSPALDS